MKYSSLNIPAYVISPSELSNSHFIGKHNETVYTKYRKDAPIPPQPGPTPSCSCETRGLVIDGNTVPYSVVPGKEPVSTTNLDQVYLKKGEGGTISALNLIAKEIDPEVDTVSVSIDVNEEEHSAIIGAGLTENTINNINSLFEETEVIYSEFWNALCSDTSVDFSDLDNTEYDLEDEVGWFGDELTGLTFSVPLRKRDEENQQSPSNDVDKIKEALRKQIASLKYKKQKFISSHNAGRGCREQLEQDEYRITVAVNNFNSISESVSPTIEDGHDTSNNKHCCSTAATIFNMFNNLRKKLNEYKNYQYSSEDKITRINPNDYQLFIWYDGFKNKTLPLNANVYNAPIRTLEAYLRKLEEDPSSIEDVTENIENYLRNDARSAWRFVTEGIDMMDDRRNYCITFCDSHIGSANVIENQLAEDHKELHSDNSEVKLNIYLQDVDGGAESYYYGSVAATRGSHFSLPEEINPGKDIIRAGNRYKIDELTDQTALVADKNKNITLNLIPYFSVNYYGINKNSAQADILNIVPALKGEQFDIEDNAPYAIGDSYTLKGTPYTLVDISPKGTITIDDDVEVQSYFQKDTILSVYIYNKPEKYLDDYTPESYDKNRGCFTIRKGKRLSDHKDFDDKFPMRETEVFSPKDNSRWHYKDDTSRTFDPNDPVTENTYLVGAWKIKPTYNAFYQGDINEMDKTLAAPNEYVDCGTDIESYITTPEREGYENGTIDGDSTVTYKKHVFNVNFKKQEHTVTWLNERDNVSIAREERHKHGDTIDIGYIGYDKYPTSESYYDENTGYFYEDLHAVVVADSDSETTYGKTNARNASTLVTVTKDLTIKCEGRKSQIGNTTISANVEAIDITKYSDSATYEAAENQPPLITNRTYNLSSTYVFQNSGVSRGFGWKVIDNDKTRVNGEVEALVEQLRDLYGYDIQCENNKAWDDIIKSNFASYILDLESYKNYANTSKYTIMYSKFNVNFKMFFLLSPREVHPGMKPQEVELAEDNFYLSGGYVGYLPHWPSNFPEVGEEYEEDSIDMVFCCVAKDDIKQITKNSPKNISYTANLWLEPLVTFEYGENSANAVNKNPGEYIVDGTFINPIKLNGQKLNYPEVTGYNKFKWKLVWNPEEYYVSRDKWPDDIVITANFEEKETLSVTFAYDDSIYDKTLENSLTGENLITSVVEITSDEQYQQILASHDSSIYHGPFRPQRPDGYEYYVKWDSLPTETPTENLTCYLHVSDSSLYPDSDTEHDPQPVFLEVKYMLSKNSDESLLLTETVMIGNAATRSDEAFSIVKSVLETKWPEYSIEKDDPEWVFADNQSALYDLACVTKDLTVYVNFKVVPKE